MPKVGHRVRVTGIYSRSQNPMYHDSIKNIKSIVHLENNPQLKVEIREPKVLVNTESLIAALSERWQTLNEITDNLDISDDQDKRFIQTKLKVLTRNQKIKNQFINNISFWKL
jgi:hypothetical protein